MKTFSERIKALRKAKGVSQTEAAKGMGISSGFLSQLEGGANDNPTIGTVQKISEFYGVPMDILIPSKSGPQDDVQRMFTEVVKSMSREEAEKVLEYIRFIGSSPKHDGQDQMVGGDPPDAAKA